MKRFIFRASNLLCLLYSCSAVGQELRGTSFLTPRSTGTNAAYELLEYRQHISYPTDRSFHVDLTTRLNYQHSFRPARITEYFFGTETLTVSGSQIPNRNVTDILADYFGLSPQFQSTVELKPKMNQVTVNWSAFVSYKDFFLLFHAPLTWCRTHIGIHESIEDTSLDTVPFPAGYMDVTPVQPPYTSFCQAIQGTRTYGQVKEPLAFGHIGPTRHRTHIADFHFIGGWCFYETNLSSVELLIKAVAPDSTKPRNDVLFEPMVGNGNHPELGFGFSGHKIIWEKDGVRTVGLYGNIYATHLFSTHQKRSFDFCPNGFGSRYELMKEFDAQGTYVGTIIPVINRSTLNCRIHIDIQFEGTAMLSYVGPICSADLGYNGWIRSKEKICITEKFPALKYGLKGLQDAVGNATQSRATFNGNNIGDQTAGEFANQLILADTHPPVLLSSTNVNPNSAANPQSLLHTLFGQLTYRRPATEWLCDTFWSVGADVQFEGLHHRDDIKPNKDSVSLWGFWLKGTFEF